MVENLKETIKYDFKDGYDITDKIEDELIQIEENSHKYATENFMDILDKVKDQKEPMNVSSVGENLFYYAIHFLKGRGWTEGSLAEALRDHYHMYDTKADASDPESKSESEPSEKGK